MQKRKAPQTLKSPKTSKAKAHRQEVDVMCQNLNGTWYAFAQLGGRIFVGKVQQKAGEPAPKKLALADLLAGGLDQEAA